MATKLIIDADAGIGDALAIALALSDPDLEVLGLTATAGRVSARNSLRNLQGLVDFLDPARWPRVGRCAEDLPVAASSDLAGAVHTVFLNGETGLGDWDLDVADLHRPLDAAKLLIDVVKTQPHEVTLLTLGPLTNIAIACERAPEFLELLGGLVCAGGSMAVSGDVTAAAEFNIFADPISARGVLRSPATKTLVPLDVSRRVVLTFEQFNRLVSNASSPLQQLLQNLLPFAFRAYHEHLGQEGVPLHEVAALAAVAQPRLFTRAGMALDVETEGQLTRGMTVFDRRRTSTWQTNIDVLTDVEPQGVLDYMTRLVNASATPG